MQYGGRIWSAVATSAQNQGIEPAQEVVEQLADHGQAGRHRRHSQRRELLPAGLLTWMARARPSAWGLSCTTGTRPRLPSDTGWADIETARLLEEATLERIGWYAATDLGSGNSIWVVSLVDSDRERIYFTPLESGQLRETARIIVRGNNVLAQIRQAVPE